MNSKLQNGARFWPDYRTVWRWHFYAGLFCIPFVVLLSLSGAVYLFKPQVERWIDRRYDNLAVDAPENNAASEVRAALRAAPESQLIAYELPAHPGDAARIIVRRHGRNLRVYVHPVTFEALKQVAEEDRFERIVFKLHGQLLLGNLGSVLVELAASWAVVMIVTGLFLWWPRDAVGLGSVVYPRLSLGGRRFWRDLHGVIGFWVSFFALFLLISGLPWSYVWGNMLRAERQLAAPAVGARPDWPVGAAPEHGADHATGGMGTTHSNAGAPVNFDDLNRIVAAVRPLGLADPVLISPPEPGKRAWLAKSDAQNRTLRAQITLDPKTGAVLRRQAFGDRPLLDRIVGVGVAAHEGQLFGLLNQLLGLFTALGLLLVSISAAVMWWARRPVGVLGAPPKLRANRVPGLLIVSLLALCLALPEFGASVALLIAVEQCALRRIPPLRRWLGLEQAC